MGVSIRDAVARLNRLLPLARRQQALPAELAAVHRAILRSLAGRGRALDRAEIGAQLEHGDVDAALLRLSGDDLVVLDAGRDEVVGAYPLTVEDTPHRLHVDGRAVNAMCAVDALSVGPMFDAQVEIESHCHVTGTPVRIHMQGERILEVAPAPEVRVGVRWQNPGACAAHGLCLEIVYLRDEAAALEWQNGDTGNIDLFTLPDAVAFGAGFFQPLVNAA